MKVNSKELTRVLSNLNQFNLKHQSKFSLDEQLLFRELESILIEIIDASKKGLHPSDKILESLRKKIFEILSKIAQNELLEYLQDLI